MLSLWLLIKLPQTHWTWHHPDRFLSFFQRTTSWLIENHVYWLGSGWGNHKQIVIPMLLLQALQLISIFASGQVKADCRPCAHSSSSSSSSSSSTSSGCSSWSECSVCPDKQAKKRILELQAEAETFIKGCKSDEFRALQSQDFSFSVIGLGCEASSCCNVLGSDFYNQFYHCGDSIDFYAPNKHNIRKFSNGTVIVSKLQTVILGSDQATILNSMLNFHWSPSYFNPCDYQLSYIDGNNIGCGSYIEDLPECGLCNL